jgi:putative membrane protein
LAPTLLGCGALILGLLWLGPLADASRRSFTAHMVLHLGVVAVAAPILSFGLLAALPRMQRLRSPLLLGLAVSFAEMAVVWGWHLPDLHGAASFYDGVFAIQQASFLVAGLGLWLVSFADRSRAVSGAGVLAMLLTFMHMSMLGTALAISPGLLYAPSVCQGVLGLGPLDDQRLGGVLMASAGGLPYLTGAIALAIRVMKPSERP